MGGWEVLLNGVGGDGGGWGKPEGKRGLCGVEKVKRRGVLPPNYFVVTLS